MSTIVTAYFKLTKSKANHETYSTWMKNMLDINNNMVIFCEATMAEEIKHHRREKLDKTLIVETSIKDFYTYRYANYFLEHTKMDRESAIGHNMLLYMIWSEKSHFLKRAIELNPFGTDYFIWTDIGCFRRPNTDYIFWPNAERIAKLPKNRVLLLSVEPFTEKERAITRREDLPSFQYVNRIGGTIFGGERDVLLEWHNKYYEMLEYFISINRFIGKDQSIMNSVYLINRDMCELINWTPGCTDIWFYLQDYLR
jgi:hypothetical protein